ncbi:MAG: hypothetical protein ACO1TE_19405 [Prosthecobacter sp.]
MKPLYILSALLTLAFSVAHGQTPLPLVLSEKPLHIGDQAQKDMRNPQPDATLYEAKFDWQGKGRVGEIYLVIQVSHLVPKDYADFDKGFWKTELFLNDKPIVILNTKLRGKEETAKLETIILPLKLDLLKEGTNTLRIRPGAKDGDLDDFELHRITIEGSRPR